MAKQHRGRLIVAQIVTALQGMASPEYPMAVSAKRLPVITIEDLADDTADVTVAAMTKAGDEQDRGSELLLYGVTVGVTAKATEPESATADSVEDLIEQIQNFLSEEGQRVWTLEADPGGGEFDWQAQLELPFENNPIFNVKLLREVGIYQSITVFNYLVEKTRI